MTRDEFNEKYNELNDTFDKVAEIFDNYSPGKIPDHEDQWLRMHVISIIGLTGKLLSSEWVVNNMIYKFDDKTGQLVNYRD